MAPSNNAVYTEQIVRDITGSVLCSYQIAHLYRERRSVKQII